MVSPCWAFSDLGRFSLVVEKMFSTCELLPDLLVRLGEISASESSQLIHAGLMGISWKNFGVWFGMRFPQMEQKVSRDSESDRGMLAEKI